MHIAILKEQEDIVDYIGRTFRQTLKIGDNVSETEIRAINCYISKSLSFLRALAVGTYTAPLCNGREWRGGH